MKGWNGREVGEFRDGVESIIDTVVLGYRKPLLSAGWIISLYVYTSWLRKHFCHLRKCFSHLDSNGTMDKFLVSIQQLNKPMA